MEQGAFRGRLLTNGDEETFTRAAYAKVVTGQWSRVRRRRTEEFDFFEVSRNDNAPGYRIGRLSSGTCVAFDLRTGLRRYGSSLSDVLRHVDPAVAPVDFE